MPKQTHPESFKQCPHCGVQLIRCAVCVKEFPAVRSDAKTCSDACRQRLVYRNRKNRPARDDQQEVTA